MFLVLFLLNKLLQSDKLNIRQLRVVAALCLTQIYLRGFHGSRFDDHLDLVLGARQQLDGPGLAEPGAVGFKVDRAVVGQHLQGNPNFNDLRHVGHAAATRAQSIIEQVTIGGRARGNAA